MFVGLGALVLAGVGFSAYVQNRPARPEADARVIAHGEKVDLAAYAVPGKHTVFDFYAVWCPPCRTLGPALERLSAAHNERLAIRKVDIVDWTMPVVEQHGIEALPFLVLYDSETQRVAEGEAVFDELLALFGDAATDVLEAATAEPEPAPFLIEDPDGSGKML